MITVRGSSFEG
jgi:hypothetical protein